MGYTFIQFILEEMLSRNLIQKRITGPAGRSGNIGCD
jgi:hypothetical protein